MKLLGEKVLYQQGCFRHVVRWYEGWVNLPNSKYVIGWTGKETEQTLDIITPSIVFEVIVP